MVSLVVTKNNNGARYGDWADANKRRDGQVIAGKAMQAAFKVAGTDEVAIVRATLQACWNADCSIWMRYDGDEADSFAIVEGGQEFEKASYSDEETAMLAFLVGMIKLDYFQLKAAADGTPIQKVDPDKPDKLTLRIQDDSPPGQTANKKMNVTIPSDFADFKTDYLADMTDDIVDLSSQQSKDEDYLLSSLTFRRCL